VNIDKIKDPTTTKMLQTSLYLVMMTNYTI